jgi:hypothetical protein
MGLTELEIKVVDLEKKVSELTEERNIFREQLIKVGALEDTNKEKLLRRVLEAYPDCYNNIEFEDAFNEGAKE